jgi:hypothetical protein
MVQKESIHQLSVVLAHPLLHLQVLFLKAVVTELQVLVHLKTVALVVLVVVPLHLVLEAQLPLRHPARVVMAGSEQLTVLLMALAVVVVGLVVLVGLHQIPLLLLVVREVLDH